MKKAITLLLALMMSVSLTACSIGQVKGTVICQNEERMAVLDIMPQKLFEFADIGDSVTVTVGDFEQEMILVDQVIAEDGMLQLVYDPDLHSLSICAYNQDFCKVCGVSVNAKVLIAK